MNKQSLPSPVLPVQSPPSSAENLTDEERALSFELASLVVKKSIRCTSLEAVERGCYDGCDPAEIAAEYTADLRELLEFEERAEQIIHELDRIRARRADRRARPQPPVRLLPAVRRSSAPRARSRRIQAPRPSPASRGPDEPPGPPGRLKPVVPVAPEGRS